jgi:glycosyltransferase involved in cell wall biosynthesis
MKVLEALAAGKALVATPRAAEGVDAVAGEHFLLAAEEDDLVEALTDLLLHPGRRRAIGERARGWAEQNLGWERGVEEFEQLYDAVAAERASASRLPGAVQQDRL